MNDITKARHFLKARQSKLEHLDTFALMLTTAEDYYRNIKRRQSANKDLPGTLDELEVETAVEYAALRYLKKYNQLPKNVSDLFKHGLTLDDKRALARQWANA